MSSRVTLIAVFLAVAVAAALATGAYAVSSDERRQSTADRLQTRTEDRDAVLDDVKAQEERLTEISKSLGHDVRSVRDEPVPTPQNVTVDGLLGTAVVGDFRDVFVDEGIVLRGLKAREVDEIPRTVNSNGDKQAPLKPDRKGLRLVLVDIWVTNRSGDAADPACGLSATFNGVAHLESGGFGTILDSYDNVGTYTGACNSGLADGASGKVALGVGMREGDKLTALEFRIVGDDGSDGFSQVMVFEDPI